MHPSEWLVQYTGHHCGLPLCCESHCARSLGPIFSGSRCYIQHGIKKESRSWRLNGERPFTLEHGLSFEPALPEQRPRTLNCGARSSEQTHRNVQVGVAGPICFPISSSAALELCTQALRHLPSRVLPNLLLSQPFPSLQFISLAFLHKGWRQEP